MNRTFTYTDPGDKPLLGIDTEHGAAIIKKGYEALQKRIEGTDGIYKKRDLIEAALETGETLNEVLLIHAFLVELGVRDEIIRSHPLAAMIVEPIVLGS